MLKHNLDNGYWLRKGPSLRCKRIIGLLHVNSNYFALIKNPSLNKALGQFSNLIHCITFLRVSDLKIFVEYHVDTQNQIIQWCLICFSLLFGTDYTSSLKIWAILKITWIQEISIVYDYQNWNKKWQFFN